MRHGMCRKHDIRKGEVGLIRVGSLFSGIGGIELGLERTGGFKTIWFIENNEYCQQVLRKHWPSIPIYGDVKTIETKRRR